MIQVCKSLHFVPVGS